jgi:hypothetical protein
LLRRQGCKSIIEISYWQVFEYLADNEEISALPTFTHGLRNAPGFIRRKRGSRWEGYNI